MVKELTEQEKQSIRDAVMASCKTKGISGPLYNTCVQLGYEDALKHASQGKLSMWFGKVNSFVQSQGGLTGILQSVSSVANQYKSNVNPMAGTIPPPVDETKKSNSDTTGLWIFIIVLLIVLIIAATIYFRKKGNGA